MTIGWVEARDKLVEVGTRERFCLNVKFLFVRRTRGNRQVPFSTFGKVMVQTGDNHAALPIPMTVESAPDGKLMLPQCGKLMVQVTLVIAGLSPLHQGLWEQQGITFRIKQASFDYAAKGTLLRSGCCVALRSGSYSFTNAYYVHVPQARQVRPKVDGMTLARCCASHNDVPS